MEFTGHIIGNGIVTTESDKVQQIQEAKRPTTKKQVRSFLRLVGFYQKYVPKFATIAAPLSNATKKGELNKIRWNSSLEDACTKLKEALMTLPVLWLPEFRKQFEVHHPV
jgi:hypothetical protein